MKKSILAAAFLVLWSSLAFAASEQAVGHVAAIKGTVEIQRPLYKIKARLGEKIFLKDVIEVKKAAGVKILLKNDSLLTLTENSSIKIKEYFGKRRTATEIGKSIFYLAAGKVRAVIGKNRFLDVQTPTAIVGVKGTVFTVEVEEEDGRPVTYAAVHEGEVEVKNSDEKVIGEITLGEGEMTKIYEGVPPEDPSPMPAETEAELLECNPTE